MTINGHSVKKLNLIMNNKIFNTSENELMCSVNSILIEKNIEGFIFSFFNYYKNIDNVQVLDKELKKEIIQNQDIFLFTRDKNLFNITANEITLTDAEIECINSGYFEGRLNNLYENIENHTLKFFIENKTNFKNETLETLKKIEKRINTQFYDAYNIGKIKNLHELNTKLFRNLVKYRFENFKNNVLLLSSILENNLHNNNIESAWINVFKEEKDFSRFKLLVKEKNIINPYLDFSFIFTELIENEKIYKLQYFYLLDWLLRNNFINNSNYLILKKKKAFEKKSSTESRINIYNKYFL